MAVGDIYQVRVGGGYLGISWENVWWYSVFAAGVGQNATQLATLFEDNVIDNYTAAANPLASFQFCEVINWGTPADSASIVPSPSSGQREEDSDPAPSFLSVSVRVPRNGPGTRYGYKRFIGAYELDFNGNSLSSSGVTAWTDTAHWVYAPLIAAGSTYYPCQVRSGSPLGVKPTLNFLYTEPALLRLGTQNTRKP